MLLSVARNGGMPSAADRRPVEQAHRRARGQGGEDAQGTIPGSGTVRRPRFGHHASRRSRCTPR